MHCALCSSRVIDPIAIELPAAAPGTRHRQVSVCWRCLTYRGIEQLMQAVPPAGGQPSLN
jgi:hypothetical protein